MNDSPLAKFARSVDSICETRSEIARLKAELASTPFWFGLVLFVLLWVLGFWVISLSDRVHKLEQPVAEKTP